ncbi:MAG: hypothetical protein ACK5DM_17390 [Planctomyces sp.]
MTGPRSTHCTTQSVLTVLLLVACCLASGCRSSQKQHHTGLQAWRSGDLQNSAKRLQKASGPLNTEKELLLLDQSIIALASGEPQVAESHLRSARDRIDYLKQKNAVEQTASVLSDSRAIAWSGREFEHHMLVNVAMLSSLVNDGQDAWAWSLQAMQTSKDRRDALVAAATKSSGKTATSATSDSTTAVTPASFENSPPPKITAETLDQPLALAAYLTAIVHSEKPTETAETERALQDVRLWNPQFSTASAGKLTPLGIQCRKTHGTLHVIVLAGVAPEWVSESCEPTSAALLIADQILSAQSKHSLPPTLFSVKIARPQSTDPARADLTPGAAIVGTGIGTERRQLGFSTIVDLREVAQASYLAGRDKAIADAVVRRVVKKGTVVAAKAMSNQSLDWKADLAMSVVGVAWEALEKADTRSWSTLPAAVRIAAEELPSGEYNLDLWTRPLSERYPVHAQPVKVRIEDGRNTCVLLTMPSDRITGAILLGGADRNIIPAP